MILKFLRNPTCTLCSDAFNLQYTSGYALLRPVDQVVMHLSLE